MFQPNKGGWIFFIFFMLNPEILELHDGIKEEADPLTLDLSDEEYIETINQSIQNSINYYTNKNLYSRQDKMLGYYLGNQLPTGKRKLADWQTPYIENIVYEGVRRIKPIATSRLPDLTVKSSNNPEVADKVSDIINTDIKKRKNRRVLGLAHVHEQLFFYAIIKGRWNPALGDRGDYEFINVYPKNVVWDHTCLTHDADDMRFVAENAELTVKEIIMMFPQKEEEFLASINFEEGLSDQKKMATKMKLWEVWFHWYKERRDEETGEAKWEKIHGVVWKCGQVILGSMKNPYFDYEGKVRLFDPRMKEKQQMSNEDILGSITDEMMQGMELNTIYYNYFKQPRKPYFFMVYESLGDNPIDATNRIEQILYFQDHINDEGRQIIDMNERSAGKVVFSSEALDKKVVENLDWRNTKQAVSVNGDDVTKAMSFFQSQAAPAQLYKSKEENRSIGFEMMGVNATTRGVREGDQTLGEAQMFREQDFGFIDDLVEDTINEAAEWMAQWSMQFIRIFYTRQRYKEIVGKDGDSVYMAVDQDFIDDGMVVEVSASAVDKLMKKRLAMESFKMGASDILSFYEDMGIDNAKEKARRAFLQKTAPQLYYQTYLSDGEPLPQQMMPQGAPAQQPQQQ